MTQVKLACMMLTCVSIEWTYILSIHVYTHILINKYHTKGHKTRDGIFLVFVVLHCLWQSFSLVSKLYVVQVYLFLARQGMETETWRYQSMNARMHVISTKAF